MIESWTLKNFKSVRDEITLETAPLTVFSGPNSSGKSTIIQSILMAAQTLQSSVSSRSVILNGNIVRLGAFSDILSNNHQTDEVVVGFKLTPQVEDRHIGTSRYMSFRYRHMMHNESYYKLPISCRFSFSAKGKSTGANNLELQPLLDECSIGFVLKQEAPSNAPEILIKNSNLPLEEKIRSLGLNANGLPEVMKRSLEYEVVKPVRVISSRRALSSRLSGFSYSGVTFDHFLPKAFSIIFDEVNERAQDLTELLISKVDLDLPFRYRVASQKLDQVGKNDKFIQIVLNEIRRELKNGDPLKPRMQKANNLCSKLQSDFSVLTLIRLLKNLYHPQRVKLIEAFSKRSSELVKAARGDLHPNYAIRLIDLPDESEYIVDSIQEFFTRDVKYLGPLRDEPKPIYPISSSSDSRDVGIKGEYTASVLDIHHSTEVTYIPSQSFIRGINAQSAKRANLFEAVLDWLSYMGVASNIETSDRGKIGRELKVVIAEGKSLHDLIHVGVGVSQVLPIVVLALLAEKGSTLIFEQPELHLHPKVQTRLADFLLSLSILGKQCIVETHSEHLINRLCYCAAKAEGKEVSGKVIIYFVENIKGQSRYQPIRINEFGVIENWPVGFFDETETAASEILRAGIEKRNKENVAK